MASQNANEIENEVEMNGANDGEAVERDTQENDENLILSDQDETALGTEPKLGQSGRFLKRSRSVDLEEAAVEDMSTGRDLKSQMDRSVRIADANAQGHHLSDEFPDETPGGLEEVNLKTDEDLIHRGLAKAPRTPIADLQDDFSLDDESDDESIDEVIANALNGDIESDTDEGVTYDETAFGSMNEADARESGYLKEYDNKHSQTVRVTRDGVQKIPREEMH